MRRAVVLPIFLLAACGDSAPEEDKGAKGPFGAPDPSAYERQADELKKMAGERPAPDAAKALTESDIEKFLAAARDVVPIKPSGPTTAAMRSFAARRAEAIEKHGLTEMEYGLMEARVKNALVILDFKAPVPPEMKADCDIVRKHHDALKAAMGMK